MWVLCFSTEIFNVILRITNLMTFHAFDGISTDFNGINSRLNMYIDIFKCLHCSVNVTFNQERPGRTDGYEQGLGSCESHVYAVRSYCMRCFSVSLVRLHQRV